MARYDTTDILEKIHRLVELNVDYPSSGDDEYELRLGLVNDHIEEWEGEEGTEWNELWTLASFNCTGATSYDLSSTVSTMKYPGGFVEYVDGNNASTYWPVIKPEEVRLYTNSGERFAYFLGNPQAGFTLYFNPNAYPTAVTGTIKFPFYAKATRLSAAGDKPQMSDPQFLVHSTASDILSQEDPGESDKHLQLAQSRLRGMKTTNLMAPHWQSNRTQDLAGHLKGAGFGK